MDFDSLNAMTIGLLHATAIRDCQRVVVVDSRGEMASFHEGLILKADTFLLWASVCKIVGYALSYSGRDKPGVPGFYEYLGLPEIEVIADGVTDHYRRGPKKRLYVGAQSLMPYDQDAYRQRLQELLPQYRTLPDRGKLIAPSPETPFWEGDWVRVREGVDVGKRQASVDERHGGGSKVHAINFNAPLRQPKERETHAYSYDFPNMPARYALQDAPYSHWSGYWQESELELVERGHIWRRAHNEPLQFADLVEELLFAYEAGEYTVARDPETNRTWWYQQQEAAKVLLEKGQGHILDAWSNGGTSWDRDDHWSILKFNNEALGQRALTAAKRGFVLPSSTWAQDFAKDDEVIKKMLALAREG